MEQMQMNFGKEDPKPSLSELEKEIQDIMETEGPGYEENRDAAEKLAKIRIAHRKSGNPSVKIIDHFED